METRDADPTVTATVASGAEPLTVAGCIASPPVGPNLGNMTWGNQPKGIGTKGFPEAQEGAPVRTDPQASSSSADRL
ncbi:MAG: hypothetical protein KDJ36_04095 [Hyphomicrobiaceae bacterium]|nr:hypothetical protein [Hyphomicrobiaceae bacterium]